MLFESIRRLLPGIVVLLLAAGLVSGQPAPERLVRLEEQSRALTGRVEGVDSSVKELSTATVELRLAVDKVGVQVGSMETGIDRLITLLYWLAGPLVIFLGWIAINVQRLTMKVAVVESKLEMTPPPSSPQDGNARGGKVPGGSAKPTGTVETERSKSQSTSA